MAAGSIVIDLLMRTGAFETDTKRAAQIAERRAKEIEKTFAAAGTAIAAGMTAAFGAVTASIASSVRQAGEISKLAQIANATTTEFQTWAAASKTVGIEQDKLGDILKDVNDRVGDFLQTGGGPMKDFFEQIAPRIGITAEAFRNLSGPQALQLYVDSLQKAGVSQQEMTFYLEAMASDTTALIPLLANGGAELKRLGDEAARTGQIMSSETIAASKMLSEQTAALTGQWQGAQNVLAAALIPSLVSLGNEMTTVKGQTSAAKEIADGIAATFEWIVVAAAGAKTAIAGVGNAIGATAAAASEVGGGAKRGVVALFETWAKDGTVAGLRAGWAEVSKGIEGASRVGDLMREDAQRGAEEYTKFRDAILGARQAAAGAMVGPPDLRVSSGPGVGALPPPAKPRAASSGRAAKVETDALADAARAYAAVMEQLNSAQIEALSSGQELTATQRAMLDVMSDPTFAQMPEAWRIMVAEQAEYAIGLEMTAASQERLNELLGATPTAQLESTRETMQFLTQAFEAGKISAEQYTEAVQTALGTINEKTEETSTTLEEMAKKAGQNIQDAFAEFLYDPFADGLDGMLKGFGEMLRRMAAEAAAAQIARSLFDWGTTGGGSGSWVGSIVGAIFGGARASGGDVIGSRSYLVGEQGPEMFVPRTAGTILPAAATAGAMSGQTINLTVNVASGTPAEVRRAAGAGAREALSAYTAAQRYA